MHRLTRTSVRRTSLAACLTCLALAVGFVPAGVASASAPAASTTSSSPASRYPNNCYSVKKEGEAQSHLECYRYIRRLARNYRVGYRDSLVNNTSRTATLECEASESRTFEWGASVTVSASIKAGIFASIDASVSAEFHQSVTSGTSVKGSVTVPAHTTTYCDRVVYNERFRVRKCVNYYGLTSCKRTMFYAPSRRGWVLWDAKN